MRLRVVQLAVACCVALVVGGCGSARPPTTNQPDGLPAAGTGSSVLTSDAVDLVTGSGRWPSTEETLNAAIDKLVARCMQAKHLRYLVLTTTVLNNDDEAQIVGLANRRRQGYGLEQSDPSLTNRPQDAYVATLSPSDQRHYLQALYGADSDRVAVNLPDGGQATLTNHGCQADAIRTVAADVPRWGLITYVPQQLGNRLADELSTDPNYQAAMARWRRCMVGKGIRYLNPDDAVHALRAAYQAHGVTPELSKQEIATAVADGECALAVHLPAAATDSRRALASQLPEQDRRDLNALAGDRDAAVARATTILSQP
jgi:hypothetical protein